MKTLIVTVSLVLGAGALTAREAVEGAVLYSEHCATCHGLSLEGDGPMAGAMIMKPANLTALSSGNDGVFPLLRVVKRIDGRDPLVAHGSPMPVYGHFFEGDDTALKTETGECLRAGRRQGTRPDFARTTRPAGRGSRPS